MFFDVSRFAYCEWVWRHASVVMREVRNSQDVYSVSVGGESIVGLWQFRYDERGEDVFYLQGFDFAWVSRVCMRG